MEFHGTADRRKQALEKRSDCGREMRAAVQQFRGGNGV